MDYNAGVTGAISGFVLAALGVLGVTKRVETKVSKEAFVEYKTSIDKQFKDVNDHLSEIKGDVKELLKK